MRVEGKETEHQEGATLPAKNPTETEIEKTMTEEIDLQAHEMTVSVGRIASKVELLVTQENAPLKETHTAMQHRFMMNIYNRYNYLMNPENKLLA